MADPFDPYHHWLGIPPNQQPPDHYRLLGIPRFEGSPEVISHAADARMAFVRTFQGGPNGAVSQQILNELGVARITLLNEPRKAAYDNELRSRSSPQTTSTLPMALPLRPAQQATMTEIARQLEQIKSREVQLAQQQAHCTAALAQADSARHELAQREAALRQRESQLQAMQREMMSERQRLSDREEALRREHQTAMQEMESRVSQLRTELERVRAELVRATATAETLARRQGVPPIRVEAKAD